MAAEIDMVEVMKINEVTKKYGKQKALNKVSFSINKGEVVGLIGPNGAGKSTLMKIIAGLVIRYEGEILINGENIKKKTGIRKKKVGCVIEEPGFYPYLTGYENLEFFSYLSGEKSYDEIDRIVELLELQAAIHKKVKKYSLGMKQRLGIGQAVLGKPDLLILDEPTNGLDPSIIPKIREFIKYASEEAGMAILISSHILSEIEAMCSRALFIKNGEIIYESWLEDEKNKKSLPYYMFETNMKDKLVDYFNKYQINCIIEEKGVLVDIDNEEVEKYIPDIISKGVIIRAMYRKKPDLESEYRNVIGGNIVE